MKYITLKNLEAGRSGHRLKDYLTCYLFSFLIDDLMVLPMQEWNDGQSILKFPVNKHFKDYNFNKLIDIEEPSWEGLSFETFCKIKNKISNLPDNSLITLFNHTRIHPYQLTEWFKSRFIAEDVFITKFIPTLRDLYFKDNNCEVLDCLSIHVRRGDIANPEHPCFIKHTRMRWSVEYFEENIISFQKRMPDIPINIFTEKEYSNDLERLKKYNNLTIYRGDDESLKNDINTMVNSKYFMPCNSSLSTWISYISKGSVIIPPNKYIKHFHSKHIW